MRAFIVFECRDLILGVFPSLREAVANARSEYCDIEEWDGTQHIANYRHDGQEVGTIGTATESDDMGETTERP